MTGAYNFWKDKQYVIKDTINDVIQSAAFTESSIGAKFEVKKYASVNLKSKTITPKQFISKAITRKGYAQVLKIMI